MIPVPPPIFSPIIQIQNPELLPPGILVAQLAVTILTVLVIVGIAVASLVLWLRERSSKKEQDLCDYYEKRYMIDTEQVEILRCHLATGHHGDGPDGPLGQIGKHVVRREIHRA